MSSTDRHLLTDERAAELGANRPSPDALLSLANWARQLSLRSAYIPLTPSQRHTIETVTDNCLSLVTFHPSSPQYTTTTSSALVFLGSASGCFHPSNSNEGSQKKLEDIIQAIGTVLLLSSPQSTDSTYKSNEARQLTTAVATAFPSAAAFLPTPHAACWLFTSLLHASMHFDIGREDDVDDNGDDGAAFAPHTGALSGLYSGFRAAITASLLAAPPTSSSGSSSTTVAAVLAIEHAYGVVRAVLLPIDGGNEKQRSVAVLIAGGMLDALVRQREQQRPNARVELIIQGLVEVLMRQAAHIHSTRHHHHREWRLEATATSLSIAQAYTRHPTTKLTSIDVIACTLSTLFNVIFDLRPLQKPKPQTSLFTWQQYMPIVIRTTLEQMDTAPPGVLASHRQEVLSILEHATLRIHEQYRQYIVDDWAHHRQQQQQLQQLLERCFSVTMEVVTRVEKGGPSCCIAATLGILANLQFCRVSTNAQYGLLVQYTVENMSQNTEEIKLAFSFFPPYHTLQRPCPAHGNAPAWLIDALSASKIQFLFDALSPCLAAVITATSTTTTSMDASTEDKDTVMIGRAVSLAFLYLLHPHPATGASAHRFLWSLWSASPVYAEQCAPYYAMRCLDGIHLQNSNINTTNNNNDEADVQQRMNALSQGLSTAFHVLPATSAVPLLCVQRILGTCRELGAAGTPCWDDRCVALFSVAVQQLFSVHYALKDGVFSALQGFIGSECPERLRGRVCGVVASAVASSEDCVRKPGLVKRYQEMVADGLIG